MIFFILSALMCWVFKKSNVSIVKQVLFSCEFTVAAWHLERQSAYKSIFLISYNRGSSEESVPKGFL